MVGLEVLVYQLLIRELRAVWVWGVRESKLAHQFHIRTYKDLHNKVASVSVRIISLRILLVLARIYIYIYIYAISPLEVHRACFEFHFRSLASCPRYMYTIDPAGTLAAFTLQAITSRCSRRSYRSQFRPPQG